MRQEALRKNSPRLGRDSGAKLHRKKQNKRGGNPFCALIMPGVRFRCGVRLHEVRKKIIYMRWLLVLLLQNVTTTCGLNRDWSFGREGRRNIFTGVEGAVSPHKEILSFSSKKALGRQKNWNGGFKTWWTKLLCSTTIRRMFLLFLPLALLWMYSELYWQAL